MRKLLVHLSSLLTLVSLVCLPGITEASTIFSTGFEGLTPTGGAINQRFSTVNGVIGVTYGAGNPFTLDYGSVDVFHIPGAPSSGSRRTAPFEGTNYLELNGSAPGKISTTLSTVAGTKYTVSFMYNSSFYQNPDTADAATLTVSLSDLATQTFSLPAGENPWTPSPATYSFVASGTQSVLSFAAASPSTADYGVMLDNITVSVPEPTGTLLSGIGLVGLISLWSARRRRC